METLNNNIAIPKYLEELVRPTLGCFSKLAAAWDGLSVETQIIILEYYAVNCPSYLVSEVCKLAIKSSNEYIQYIGVKYGYRLDYSIQKFVTASNNSLLFVFKNPRFDSEYFFGLEHGQRIMFVSNNPDITIFELENILDYYYKNQSVSQEISKSELADIVVEFRNNSRIINESQFFGGPFGEILIKMLGIVDEDIGLILVDLISYKLYFGNDKIFNNIPEKVINKILSRNDIQAIDVRKQIVFNKEYSFETRCSAASRHFSIDFPSTDFSGILNMPINEKIDLLFILSFSNDCDVVTLRAVRDLVYVFGYQSGEGTRRVNAKNNIKEIIESRLRKMEYSERRREINRIRYYNIGVSQIPWTNTGSCNFKNIDCNIDHNLFLFSAGKSYSDTYDLMFNIMKDFRWNFDEKYSYEFEKIISTEFDHLKVIDKNDLTAYKIESLICNYSNIINLKSHLNFEKVYKSISESNSNENVVTIVENMKKDALHENEKFIESIERLNEKINSIKHQITWLLLFLILISFVIYFK
jgi:hypothetical protein